MAKHEVVIRRCFWGLSFRGAASRLRKALILRGLDPYMGWSAGNLEVAVDGDQVYSFKLEKELPDDKALINRVRAKVWESRSF
jgi:predicted Rdx family selenoprotein